MADSQIKIGVRLDTAQAKAEADAFEARLKRLGTTTEDMSARFSKLGSTIKMGFGLALAGVGVLAGQAVKAASDLNETGAAVDQVFGDASKQLRDYAKTASSTMGQSQNDFLNAAKTFGIFGQAAGLAGQENVKFSTQLTKLASDLASFNNTSVDDAIQSLGAALRGEAEPMRKFGVLLDDATLRSKAMEMKIYSGSGALTQQQRVLAAHAVILEQTSIQQGDFARTADGLANSQRTLSAVWEDASATIGTALTPAISEVLKQLVPMVNEYAPKLTEEMKKIPWGDMAKQAMAVVGWLFKNAETLKNIAVSIGIAVGAWKIYRTITLLAAAAQVILNVAMNANPIGILVAAVAGLVTAYIALSTAADKAGAAVARANKAKGYFSESKTFVGSLFAGKEVTSGSVREAGMAKADAAAALNARRLAAAAKRQAEIDKLTSGGTTDPSGGKDAGALAKAKKLAQEVKNNHAAAIKAIQEANKAIDEAWAKRNEADKKAYEQHADDVYAAMTEYSADVKAANEEHAAAVAAANQAYAEAEKRAIKARDTAIVKATEQHNANVLKIQADFSKKMADIVAQSMNQLRDAFAKATSTDIGSMFKDMSAQGAVSADALIANLKTRLDKVKTLAKNAAALSGAGFSQTFIEQVVAQGPDVGNKLADSLLAATPEAQSELQKLFAESQDTSAHGMDALSKQIYDSTGLATEALKNLYAETQRGLNEALAAEADDFAKTLKAIQSDFDEAMAEAKTTRDKAIADADTAWAKQLVDAQTKRDDALKLADKALKDALIESAKAFTNDLKDIETEFDAKIVKFKTGLAGLATAISGVRTSVNTGLAGAQTTITDNTPGSSTDPNRNNPGGSTTVNNNLDIKVETNTSPEAIANAVLVAMKFGNPVYKEVAFA